MVTQIPSQPTRKGLLDLPPEIRNQIYFLCLMPADETKIKFKASPSSNASNTVIVRLVSIRPDSVAVLATGKIIHHEATPILYGSNTFEFDDNVALYSFLSQINSSRSHIRNVELASLEQRGKLSLMLGTLQSFGVDLRCLTLPYEALRDGATLQKVMRKISPLLRGIKRRRRQSGGDVAVEGLVRFVAADGEAEEMQEAMDRFTKDVREELKWQLKW